MTELINIEPGAIDSPIRELGQIANQAAASSVFRDYRSRKAQNTTRRHDAALSLFAEFLAVAGIQAGDMADDPEAWRGVTWGLVTAFQRWMTKEGYAIGTINGRISTVKVYAKLAAKAEAILPTEYAMIKAVESYSQAEGQRIDEQREITRKGLKKAEAVELTRKQAEALKNHPDTPQGRRDALLMCLLLDHGLRVGEVELLTVDNFNLTTGVFTFHRPKVNKTQTHEMTPATMEAAQKYFDQDAPEEGPLIKGNYKGGLLAGRMKARAITQRVNYLGKQIGVKGLSAHDCRHYWATQAAYSGTPIEKLMEAGGWSSVVMPIRYIKAAKIANEGVKLEKG